MPAESAPFDTRMYISGPVQRIFAAQGLDYLGGNMMSAGVLVLLHHNGFRLGGFG